jgi:hypothetical protein
MDSDGYPEDHELKAIEEWDYKDFPGLIDYVKERWWMAEWGWHECVDREHPEETRYLISTGGWSGNESLIAALHKNRMFWMMCWSLSRAGGHYEFRVKP